MKTQRVRVAAALMLGLGMLVLVVVTLSVVFAPSISHASPPGQMGNPCGYGFQIDVVPLSPTTSDIVSVTYSAEWPDSCIPLHQGHQVAGNMIRLDAVWHDPYPDYCAMIISSWGGQAGISNLASGTYSVQVYLTTVTSPTVFSSTLCGTRSFAVYGEPQQAPEDLYVAHTGTDAGNCTASDFPCRTVQYAVDQAGEGSTIKVASGVYTDLNVRPCNDLATTGTVSQVAYISKTVTIRGGYTTTNWSVSHPISYPTILDAWGQGRVLYITGAPAPSAGISLTIEGLRITGGDSAGMSGGPWGESGGGVYAISAAVTISGCQVFSNTSNRFIPYGGDGGGIYLINSPNATLIGNTIQNNTAWYGGGVYLHSSENATLIGNTILDNGAYGWYGASGGGVLLGESANAMLTGNIIQGNVTQVGGGVFLANSDHVTLKGNTIFSNTALGSHTFLDGGGISMWNSDNTTLIGNIIQDNLGDEGGGICLSGSHNVTLENNLIADNQCWGAAGSGIYIEGSTVYLRHTTLARNAGGSGLYIVDWPEAHSTVAMTNTILVGHTVGITVAAGSTATLEGTLWGSDVWGNTTDWGGSGLIVTGTSAHNYWGDPAFVNPGTGDYHINSASAAFNAGIDAGVTEDIDGDPRSDGYPDIGADELQAALRVTKRAYPSIVQPGERLTYTVRITNVGSLDLHATITDTLPFSVTLGGTLSGTVLLPGKTVVLPDGAVGITWTAFITAPGGMWMETVVVTVDADYTGPLTNVVQVTTEEGATGVCTETSTAIILRSVYLPLVMRNVSGATAIVGEYLFVGNPCTADPCLPGMVYAALENDTTLPHSRRRLAVVESPLDWIHTSDRGFRDSHRLRGRDD